MTAMTTTNASMLMLCLLSLVTSMGCNGKQDHKREDPEKFSMATKEIIDVTFTNESPKVEGKTTAKIDYFADPSDTITISPEGIVSPSSFPVPVKVYGVGEPFQQELTALLEGEHTLTFILGASKKKKNLSIKPAQ